MGRSRYLNVDCARSQEAYFSKVREAVRASLAGEVDVACPRDGCESTVDATMNGGLVSLRCATCGLIFRGSAQRLLAHYTLEAPQEALAA